MNEKNITIHDLAEALNIVSSTVIDGIEQIAKSKNYRVIISQTKDDPELEKQIVDGLF